jgi:hypothetical protein
MQLEALKASDANSPDLVSEKQCSHKKKEFHPQKYNQ